MQEKKINLKEIIESHRNNTDHWADQDFNEYGIKQICLKFGKQLLELASENAKITVSCKNQEDWFTDFYCGPSDDLSINKQSILDTIKQVE